MNALARDTLIIGPAVLASGCGGSQPPLRAPNWTNDIGRFASHRRTFHCTGIAQSFKVPAGITHVTIKASGASGPSQGGSSCHFTGGNGELAGCGGGGSSYIEPNATNTKNQRGAAAPGNGLVVTSW